MFSNPWVIGIGTTFVASLIVGLILYFVFGVGKTQDKLGDSKPSEPITPPASLDDTPMPKEIHDYLESLPPLQEEEAAKNYRGIRVKWTVALSGSFKHPMNKQIYVIARPPDGSFPSIVFPINIDNYPQLKIMKEGQRFIVEGTIFSVGVGSINLGDCRLYFL